MSGDTTATLDGPMACPQPPVFPRQSEGLDVPASPTGMITELELRPRPGPFPGGPCIDAAEREAVARVLDSGVLSGFVGTPGDHHLGGIEVRALEQQWASLGGYEHVVSVNSATAALHAGIVAMGLPAGGEVVVPPYTMSATVAAVRMAGLEPRFADLDRDLFTLTAETIEPVVGDRTVAVVVVHLFGQMAPMAPIRALAEAHGLRILEDTAQAPGATQDGKWPGHGTTGAVFSFNQHKTITCGEGGLLATDDERTATIARLVRNHGESVVHAYPDIDGMGLVGWNYRLTELEAAVAGAQTEKLDHLTAWRDRLARRLTSGLHDIPGLAPPVLGKGNTHVWFSYAVRFDADAWGCDRSDLVAALQSVGIPSAAGYVPPLYRLPLFGAEPGPAFDPDRFPVCERLASSELLLLPVCRWPATDDDIDHVVATLSACWGQRERLAGAAR